MIYDRVYDYYNHRMRKNDICGTLTTNTPTDSPACGTFLVIESDDNMSQNNKIRISQSTKQGYIEMESGGVADLSFPNSKNRRGRVQGGGQICPTLTAAEGGIHKIDKDGSDMEKDMTREELLKRYRIRRLTAKESWRLMGFSDEDYEAATSVNSKTQLYKQAGNSICENVLVAIFGQFFEGKEDVYKSLA